MITLTRPLARQVRAVFRHALGTSPRGPFPAVSLRADQHGLTIRSKSGMAAIERSVPGEYPADEILVPGELLVDCEGRSDQVVSIERQADGDLIATWQDASVPVVMRYTPPDAAELADFPAPPESMTDNPASLLTALRDASETAEAASIRFALDHLELCGDSGTICATDSRQVLVQTGFRFPWQGKVLVPRSTLYGNKDTPANRDRHRQDRGVAGGPHWTLALPREAGQGLAVPQRRGPPPVAHRRGGPAAGRAGRRAVPRPVAAALARQRRRLPRHHARHERADRHPRPRRRPTPTDRAVAQSVRTHRRSPADQHGPPDLAQAGQGLWSKVAELRAMSRPSCSDDALAILPVADSSRGSRRLNPLADQKLEGDHMEILIVLAVVAWVAYACYRSGKRTGSIRGFNVGRHGRRWRRR